jgi:hypothetical protein
MQLSHIAKTIYSKKMKQLFHRKNINDSTSFLSFKKKLPKWKNKKSICIQEIKLAKHCCHATHFIANLQINGVLST